MAEPRWKVWLCKVCAHELKTDDARWFDLGHREVGHICPNCDARFRTHQPALDLRPGHHATFNWQEDAQGRPTLEVCVEGWPVITSPLVHHLERVTRGGAWHVVTAEGERLERLKPTNSGPLDRLIAEIVNQRLASGSERFERERIAREVGRLEPKPYFQWRAPHGFDGPHELRLWLDGWMIDVAAHVGPLTRSPARVDKDDEGWRVVVADEPQRRLSGMEGEAIGGHVQGLVNERLELLTRSSARLIPRKRRKPKS